jgi:hypothetical protein
VKIKYPVFTLVVLLFVIFCFFAVKGFPPYGKDGKPIQQSEPTKPKSGGMIQMAQ